MSSLWWSWWRIGLCCTWYVLVTVIMRPDYRTNCSCWCRHPRYPRRISHRVRCPWRSNRRRRCRRRSVPTWLILIRGQARMATRHANGQQNSRQRSRKMTRLSCQANIYLVPGTTRKHSTRTTNSYLWLLIIYVSPKYITNINTRIVILCLWPQTLYLSRRKNRHGHWVCWMSTGRRNGLTWGTHTHL